MAANQVFERVDERGWRRGLGNLLHAEFGSWWKTSAWWVQSLIWVGVINLIIASLVWGSGDPEAPNALSFYPLFSGLFPPIAIIIILQDAIVGEKESGTAAWVLSKPVSRAAFVISKLLANAVGVLVTMVLFPGIAAYLQISLSGGEWLNPLNFLGGMVVLGVYQLFFLTLTLMLGTLFHRRAPVIGFPLAIAFTQNMLVSMIPALGNIFPWGLIAPLEEPGYSVAEAVILGMAPQNSTPLVAGIVFIGIFISIAVYRFRGEEF